MQGVGQQVHEDRGSGMALITIPTRLTGAAHATMVSRAVPQ